MANRDREYMISIVTQNKRKQTQPTVIKNGKHMFSLHQSQESIKTYCFLVCFFVFVFFVYNKKNVTICHNFIKIKMVDISRDNTRISESANIKMEVLMTFLRSFLPFFFRNAVVDCAIHIGKKLIISHNTVQKGKSLNVLKTFIYFFK